MTVVAIMSANHSKQETDAQVNIRMEACEALEKYCKRKKSEVIVLTSSESHFADMITAYFSAMQDVTCDSLTGDIAESCIRIKSYIDTRLCMVIVISENKIASKLACALIDQIGGSSVDEHIPGMPPIHVIH